MSHHITSFFAKRFKRESTLTVDKASSSYSYFVTDYAREVDKHPNGNLIIRDNNEKEKLIRLKERLSLLIHRNSEIYTYFVNEYRQNSPVHDADGNIILFDEITENIRKR